MPESTTEFVGWGRSANSVLAELLTEGGPVDAEDLGGSGAVVSAMFEDGLKERGLDLFKEPLVERGIGGEGGGIGELVAGPGGDRCAEIVGGRPTSLGRGPGDRWEMLGRQCPTPGDDRGVLDRVP